MSDKRDNLKAVLFIGPYPPPYAGPEQSMKNLLESNLRNRFNIVFLNTNVRKSNHNKGRFDLVMVLAFFSFIFRLTKNIIKYHPSLVYYFVTATRIGWLGRDVWCIALSKLFGLKIVIHMRAGHFKSNYERMTKFEQWLIKKSCSMVDLGIVQSECLKNQYQSLIPEHKIVSIYNSVDTDIYDNKNISTYNKNSILFLGHLSYAKGYCDLLQVIPEVVKLFPDVIFSFAGTFRDKERNVFHNQITGEKLQFKSSKNCLDEYIGDQYKKNYQYLGVVSGKDKIELLRNCNFLVLPSYSEGFSMSVLEAMAMGKPVVCSPVGAMGDIVIHGENGLINNPGDNEQLKDNIIALLDNVKMRNDMAENNYTCVRSMFRIDIITEQIGDCFESLF